jgi:hypothetical protein
VGEQPGDPAAPQVPHPEPAPEPATKPANLTSSPNLDRSQPSVVNPFINPESLNRVLAETGHVFDAVLDKPSSLRLSFAPGTGFSAQRR